MLRSLLALGLALAFSSLQAADAGYQPDLGASGVQVTSPAKDPETIALVDKMNEHSLHLNIVNSFENTRKRYDNRIRYELLLGGAALLMPTPDSIASGVLNYRLNSTADLKPAYTLGVKINLNNLKRIQPESTLSEITRIRHLLSTRDFKYKDALLKEMDAIEQETRTYMDQFWFKRWSIGVAFPFLYRTNRGFEYYTVTTGSGTSTSSNIYYETTPGFGFDQAIFFVGSDLGDLATIQLGYSLGNAVALGITIDISTPTYLFVDAFYTMLRSFAGTPNVYGYRTDYYSRY